MNLFTFFRQRCIGGVYDLANLTLQYILNNTVDRRPEFPSMSMRESKSTSPRLSSRTLRNGTHDTVVPDNSDSVK